MSSTNTYTEQKQYVVYHTTYSGDKFPANYIGSTSLRKFKSGYKGSVASKNYKSIWDSELKENPHLFSVIIISYHDTRPEATYKELQLQKIFNVVENPLFVNMSYAKPNGFFGKDNSGPNNPMYGKKRDNSHLKKPKKEKPVKIKKPKKTPIIKTPIIAKHYEIINPQGFYIITKNLKIFCAENKLDRSHMYRAAKTSNKYKGWYCFNLE